MTTAATPTESAPDLRTENHRLQEQLREAANTITRQADRIRLLEKALFGPRSERLVPTDEDQAEFESLLAEIEDLSEKLDEEPAEEPSPRTGRKKNKRRDLEELAPEDLPVKEIVIEPPEEERICLETGEPMEKIGEERSRKLAYRPGEYFWMEYVRPKYAAKGHPEEGVAQAPMPAAALPGSRFDESFLASVVVDKCAYHMPLYRQEERMRCEGLQVSRQTLSRLYIDTAEALRPLYDATKAHLLDSDILFTDDTHVDLQEKGRGRTKTGRMWVYIRGGPGPPIRVFEFTPDRRKVHPKEFLGPWRGYLHADAYAGYADLFELDGMYECACWAHVRRKFFEAEDGPPEVRQAILHAIRRLFRYNRWSVRRAKLMAERDGDPEGGRRLILDIRREKIAPLIDYIFDRCAQAVAHREVLPKSAFAKAIGYLQGRGDALRTFLGNADLHPDNGVSERAIRALAIGRKNWLFAGSLRGGEATSILLTLIQNCRALGIDPWTYLVDVLRRLPTWPKDRLEELLPHRWQPQEA